MLPADITSIRPIATVEAPTPVGSSANTSQEHFQRLAQLPVGEQLPAKILSQLEDGTFIVSIADTTARMSLPIGAKVGDSLKMTLVDTEPRPTFLVGAEAAADTGSTPATLSSAARMIDRVLQNAQETGTPTALIGKTPLAASPATAPAQVATALQNAIGSSGLFYESHVAEWAEGSRTLPTLMQEPQAQAGIRESVQLNTVLQNWTDSGRSLPDLVQELQTQVSKTTEPGTQTLPHAQTAQVAQAIQANTALPASLRNFVQQWTNSGRSLSDLTHAVQAQMGVDKVPPANTLNQQAAQMVNLQLNTLENQRVAWHGELWPGQPLQWEVSKDAPERHAGTDDDQQSWHSMVRFQLPTLGTVSATIHLVGDRVNLFVRTATESAASTLRAHGNELAEALKTAGSPMDSLVVQQENAEPDAKT